MLVSAAVTSGAAPEAASETGSDPAPSHGARIREQGRARRDETVFHYVALDGTGSALTWGELDDRSSQLAGALTDRSVGEGDRIGIGLRNSPECVLAIFAAWKIGAVPVPVRWDLPDWELARVREVLAARLYLAAEDLPWIRASAEAPIPDLPDVISPHTHGICSSGSTGTPKIIVSGAPGTYLPAFATPFADQWTPIPRPQHILVLAPMYHINAFATLYQILVGDHLTMLEKFDAALAVDVIERHHITTFTATPTMLQRLADLSDIRERDLSSIAWILQGAAPMPPALVHRWVELIDADKIYMSYGMTEGLGTTALRGDEWMLHQGSVGRGTRATDIRIIDSDGMELPPGEVGDVYLRSDSYGGSLYVGEAPALPTTEDGFRTVGDMGYLDDDGYLYIIDRRVDLIVTGGANVFPAEVEAAIIDHPKVADVVVIGLRDPEWGRRVHALIEPVDAHDPPTYEEIRAFAKTRVAAFKAPHSIEVIDAIPRSEATKVNRGRLVEERDE
ncbi:MAG: feruloyl-CoA synthetase [Acidimicrobiia bacterium]|nr:feruloyl-CoA synthetase [Acidimicrobiia bacterium]